MKNSEIHLQKPESHCTFEDAEDLFKYLSPKHLVTIHSIKPDYAKDFLGELVDEERPTGQFFWAQVKGTKKVKEVSGGSISVEIETKALVYYEKLIEPVYLILADVVNEVCYWLGIQDYMRSHSLDERWKLGKSINVHVPKKNSLKRQNLANYTKFIEAIKQEHGNLRRLSG